MYYKIFIHTIIYVIKLQYTIICQPVIFMNGRLTEEKYCYPLYLI